MKVLHSSKIAVCDRHDASVILPGDFKMKLLSRAPLSTRVASLGAFCTEFKAKNLQFTAFVGFSAKPANMNPYIRFIAVKVKSDTDICRPEGMYIEGDPLAQEGAVYSGRKAESYIRRFCPDESIEHAHMCYNVIAGIYRMISELNLLDGKGFRPLMKTSEILLSPIGKSLLASFVDDPRGGFKTTIDMIQDHIFVEPLRFNITTDPNGALVATLEGAAHVSGRLETLPLIIKGLSAITSCDYGPLSASLEVNPNTYVWGTVFPLEDRPSLVFSKDERPSLKGGASHSAIGKKGFLRVVNNRGYSGPKKGPDIEMCSVYIPVPSNSRVDGLILNGEAVGEMVGRLQSLLDDLV